MGALSGATGSRGRLCLHSLALRDAPTSERPSQYTKPLSVISVFQLLPPARSTKSKHPAGRAFDRGHSSGPGDYLRTFGVECIAAPRDTQRRDATRQFLPQLVDLVARAGSAGMTLQLAARTMASRQDFSRVLKQHRMNFRQFLDVHPGNFRLQILGNAS